MNSQNIRHNTNHNNYYINHKIFSINKKMLKKIINFLLLIKKQKYSLKQYNINNLSRLKKVKNKKPKECSVIYLQQKLLDEKILF